jgi:ferredoxin
MKELKPYQQHWLKLSTSICETLSMPGIQPIAKKNMTGRVPVFHNSDSLAYVYGVVSTGVRASAWITDESYADNVNILSQAVRNLQPLVIVAESTEWKAFADAGAFVLNASDAQELIDFTIIAHKVAELSLIPGVVWCNIQEEASEIIVNPDNESLMQYLGEADARIASATAAQQLLFGKTRKQIPGFFNVDSAVLSGAKKSDIGKAYEAASHEMFISEFLNECISKAFVEFEKIFLRKHDVYYVKNLEGASLAVFTENKRVFEVTQTLRFKLKPGIAWLKQLAPLPALLKKQSKQVKQLAVIEQSTNNQTKLFSSLCKLFADSHTSLYAALFAKTLTAENLQAYIQLVIEKPELASPQWLDIAFIHENSNLPKRQALHQYLSREYPQLKSTLVIQKNEAQTDAEKLMQRIPMALRKYKDDGPVYSRLANFYDHAALLYENNSAEWTADPYQALTTVPPATAGFGQAVQERTKIPVLNSGNCTACGDCFIHCPHAALPALALDAEAFIKSGIDQAQKQGQNISQMIPQVKNLAKAINKIINQSKTSEPVKTKLTLSELMIPAFEELIKQLKLEGDKLEAIQIEFDFIISHIGAYQIVIAENCYNDAQKLLFSLNVDPNACTGCGICADVCADSALSMEQIHVEHRDNFLNQFSTWEKLPDTSAETIEAMLAKEDYASIAAILLSRNFYMSMTGASATEIPAVKSMLHVVTALTEAAVQPGFQKMRQQIDEKIESLASQLKKELTEALPDLAIEGLENLQKKSLDKISIDELLKGRSNKGHAKLLDKAVLERKSGLIKELNALKELLLSGASDMGRSRYAIALDNSLRDLATYPLNCFTVPVILFDGKLAEMATGLVQGHLRNIIDNIKVLRRAALEEKNKYNPIIHDHEIAGLEWNDLSDEEKSFAPPLLIVIQRNKLQYMGSGFLAKLLSEDLPVKVILLDDANPNIHGADADIVQQVNALIPFIGLSDVQVMQSSLAQPEHLFEGLISGMAKNGSAIFQLLTPDFSQGNMQMYHSLANNTRAFIHFDYRPDRKQQLRFSKIKIDSNPSSNTNWMQVQLKFGKEEGQTLDYTLTRADWAYLQADRKSFFSIWNEKMGEALPVADYLKLDQSERKNQVPVIIRVNANGELLRYVVASQIIRETKASLESWNMIRELAGALVEFPKKVFAKAEKESGEKYAAEKQQLIQDYEQKMKTLEQNHLEKLRAQIKNKLMNMAGVNQ